MSAAANDFIYGFADETTAAGGPFSGLSIQVSAGKRHFLYLPLRQNRAGQELAQVDNNRSLQVLNRLGAFRSSETYSGRLSKRNASRRLKHYWQLSDHNS